MTEPGLVPECAQQRDSDEGCMAAAQRAVLDYIDRSSVPEDPAHARNTLEWVLRLWPGADPAMRLAALAHDIDRASTDKVRRCDYADYDSFKAAHARHGAQILCSLLSVYTFSRATVDEACRLVCLHEVGGDPRADLLRDADSLSYFETNLPLYFQREGEAETLRRCTWGVKRLSAGAVERLRRFEFHNPEIQRIVEQALEHGRQGAVEVREQAGEHSCAV